MPARLTAREFAELDRLFHEAMALPRDERAGFVERVRARSLPLGDRLAAMLDGDTEDASLVERIVSQSARDALDADDGLVGERFGPYIAERVVGRGGMGAVFLGRRADDEFQQTVAIKTIRAGLETADARERFRRERAILARLDHPGIARLVDGGTGPRGAPFVAMEYVEGTPLLAHVAERRVGLRGRLELFLELCDAVTFVHRSLVVHRDIKPANILVTTDGRIKLLDFGIAKLTDELSAGPALTSPSLPVMTPEYASPEQIQGQPVTTATDVYALGALVYELLTGTRPHDVDASRPYDLAHAIVSETPVMPSDAVRRTSRRPHGLDVSPRKLARQLRGDLDRIVMMALRKEPGRRYASAAALAADVRAWLNGYPVTAQPDSVRYRVRKFVGRHPVSTVAATLLLLSAAGFTTLTVQQGRALAIERDNAIVAERQAAATSAFLTRLFATADPRSVGRRNMTAFDLLQAGVAQIDAAHDLDPRVRAELYYTLGSSLANLEELEPGIAALRRGVSEIERVYGRDSLETSRHLLRLGDMLRLSLQLDEAHAVLTEALAIRRRHAGPDTTEVAEVYNNLAIVAILLGRYEEADELQIAAVEMHQRVSRDKLRPTGVALNNLSLLRRRQGRLHEALDLAVRAHDILKQQPDRSSILWALGNAANIRAELGELQTAETMLRDVVARSVELWGPTHSRVFEFERDLAYVRYLQSDYEGAEAMLADLTPRARQALGDESTSVAMISRTRAELDRDRGDLASAERRLRQALDELLASGDDRSFRSPVYRRRLAEALTDRGKLAEAEEQLRLALALLPDATAYPHVERARAQMALARVLRLSGRSAESAPPLAEARAIILNTIGTASADMGTLLLEEGLLAATTGDVAAARRLWEQAAAILRERLPTRHPNRLEVERLVRQGS